MIGTNPTPQQRFPVAAALFTLFAACGGGGGGGGAADAAPTIVTAAFLGSGSPTAGDTLLLTFSEPVTLVAGTLLTDADLVLSGGASLGNVTQAPTLSSSNTVAVTLGGGVSFVPNTTTVALGPDNDCVRDASSRLGTGGSPVVIGTSDGSAPTITRLTVADVDAALNGTGPAGGTLQVPANGWTIDLLYSDNSGVDPSATSITANVVVGTSSGAQPTGTNLRPFLTTVSATSSGASYRVPATVTFPAGAVTLSCLVADVSGLGSTPATFPATVRPFTDNLRPFETNVNASQIWFLDFTRDVESYATSAISGGATVSVTGGASGTADFDELLRVLGLHTVAPIANVQGGLNSNQVVTARFRDELLADLAEFYAGANIAFTTTQPSGTFDTASSVAYSSFGYSQISIAGAPTSAGQLGVAIFDPNNTTQNDDTRTDFNGLRLGVFLYTIVKSGFESGSTTSFRLTFNPLAPALGGLAIGNNGQDGQRLIGTLVDARSAEIDEAIADLARFTAVVTAHECGHSMGLVQNGAMPVGLYGNDTTNFPGSTDGHIRNAALFPLGSTNIMSPTLAWTSSLGAATGFNSLNLAYLQEQVYYGN